MILLWDMMDAIAPCCRVQFKDRPQSAEQLKIYFWPKRVVARFD